MLTHLTNRLVSIILHTKEPHPRHGPAGLEMDLR